PTKERGVTVARIAEVFVALMAELGYQRFAVQGGDWGSVIASVLGRAFANRVVGIHLNMVPSSLILTLEATNDAERSWRERRARLVRDESGYSHVQSTRPQTLAYGLNDSPVGLA